MKNTLNVMGLVGVAAVALLLCFGLRKVPGYTYTHMGQGWGLAAALVAAMSIACLWFARQSKA